MADLTLSVGFNAADLQTAINNVVNRTYNIRGINVNSIQQPLGKITASASEFEKSIAASNARVLAFGASASAILVVKKSMELLVNSTIEVERSITEINSVLNVSGKSSSTFFSQLFAAASSVSVSFNDASKSALEFARQGLGVEETLKRTRDSLILAKIAGMDFSDSATAITAALNSFSNELITSADLVDRLTNADANFAVSAGDLAEAIKRVGSTASDANVTLNQTIALVTAAQQVTARGGAVIGNSFKTIFTRLGRSSVLSDLERIGVSTTDAAGKMLPLVQVLKNLASTYDSLGDRQKNYVAELVGGVYQINILRATLGDVGKEGGVFEQALRTVENSAGSAEKRIEQLNQTISAKLIVSLNNASQLASAIGGKTIAPIFKGVLDQTSIFKDITDVIDGDGIGSKIANGMLGAIKGILQGPGAALLGYIVTKLTGNFGSFVGDSASSFLGLNTAAKQQSAIQAQITQYLQANPALLQSIYDGTVPIAAAQATILNNIKQQNALLSYQSNLAAQIAAYSAPAPGPAPGPARTPAAGFIPNFNSQMAGQMMENAGAREHGYTAGRAYPTTVHDGNGNAIPTFVNSREKVENFTNSAGYKATMVTPPNGFGEGTMRAARGFVPNFAEGEIGRGSGRRAFLRGENVLKTPHRTGDRRPEAVADAIGQQKLSEDFAAGLEKFPWFEAVPQKHVGGGVLKQPLAKGDTLGQVLRQAYPNYGKNAISGVLGSFDKFFQKIGLPFDRRGTPGNIIIPEERKQQLMQILKGPVGSIYARMFGHKGGFPMDAKPGDKPEPWFKLIDYAKGFVPNFARDIKIQNNGKLGVGFAQDGGGLPSLKNYNAGIYSLNSTAQAKLRKEEEEPMISLSGVVKDPLNFNPKKLISDAKRMKGDQGTYAKAGFILEKRIGTNTSPNAPIDILGVNQQISREDRKKFSIDSAGYQDLELKLQESTIKPANIISKYINAYLSGGFVPNFAGEPSKLGGAAKALGIGAIRALIDNILGDGLVDSMEMAGLNKLTLDDAKMVVKVLAEPTKGKHRKAFERSLKADREMQKKFVAAGYASMPAMPARASGGFVPNFARILDFDGTLGTAPPGITHKDTYHGWSASKMIPTPLVDKVRKEQEASRKAGKPIEDTIVTARGRESIPFIAAWLKEQGLTVASIRATGDKERYLEGMTTPDKKVLEIKDAGMLKPGTIFSDDDKRNLTAAKRAAKKEGVKGFKTHLANYGNQGIGQMAGGHIPNFANVFNKQKHIESGGTLSKANKATQEGLSNLLEHIGIPYSGPITKEGLAELFSQKQNKLKLYNYLRSDPIKTKNFPENHKEIADGNHRVYLAEAAGIKNIPTMAGGLIPNFGMVSAQVSDLNKVKARKMSEAISGENADPKRQKQHEQARKFEELSALAVGNKMTSDYPVTSLTSIPTKNLKGAAGFGGGKNFPGYDSIYKLLTSNKDLARILGVQINQPSYVPLSAKGGSNIKIAEIKRQMEKGGQVISELKKNGGLEDLDVGNSILAQASSPAKGLPGLFSDKGSFGKPGYVSKIARASGGFVPNFTRSPEEKNKVLERLSKEGVGGEALNAKAALARMSALNDADQKFITDNEKGILRAYRIGALESGSDFMNAKAGEPNSTYASRGGLPGGIADKLRGIVGKKGGRTAVFDLARNRGVTALAGGFVPNFNALKDSVGREMAAGYSASQIRIGSSKSLVTSSNPGGMGVYNSTEGFLEKGMSLAKSAGIEPKTKGMSGGFIPNFAGESGTVALISALMGSIAAIRDNTKSNREETLTKAEEEAASTVGATRANENTKLATNRNNRDQLQVQTYQTALNKAGNDAGKISAAKASFEAGKETNRLADQEDDAKTANTRAEEDTAAGLPAAARAEADAAEKKQLTSRGKAGLGISAASGFVTGMMDDGPAKQGMETFSAATGQAASIMATVPGPAGLVAAGLVLVVGAASGLYKAFSTATEIKESAIKMQKNLEDFSSASRGVVAAYGTYQESLYDASVSSEKVAQLSNEIAIAMAKLPDSMRAEFQGKMERATSQGERSSIQADMESRMTKDVAVTKQLGESAGKTDYEGLMGGKGFYANLAGMAQGKGNNRYTNTEMFYTTAKDRENQKKSLDTDVFAITESATSTKEGTDKFRKLNSSGGEKSDSQFKQELADLVPPEARAGVLKMKDGEIELVRARMKQIETSRQAAEMMGKVMDPFIQAEREAKRAIQEEINVMRERSTQLKNLVSSFTALGASLNSLRQNAVTKAQTKSMGMRMDYERGKTGERTGMYMDADKEFGETISNAAQTQRTDASKVIGDTMSRGTKTNEDGSQTTLTDKEKKANSQITEALGKVDLGTMQDPQEMIRAIVAASGDTTGEVEKRFASDPSLLASLKSITMNTGNTVEAGRIGNVEARRMADELATKKQDVNKFGGIEAFLDKSKRRESGKELSKGLRQMGSGNVEKRGEGAMRVILQAQKDLGGSLKENEAGPLKNMAIEGRSQQIEKEADKAIKKIQGSKNMDPAQKSALIGAYRAQKGRSKEIAKEQIETAAKLEKAPLDTVDELKKHTKGFENLESIFKGSPKMTMSNAGEISDAINKAQDAQKKLDSEAVDLTDKSRVGQEVGARASKDVTDILGDKEFAKATKEMTPVDRRAALQKELDVRQQGGESTIKNADGTRTRFEGRKKDLDSRVEEAKKAAEGPDAKKENVAEYKRLKYEQEITPDTEKRAVSSANLGAYDPKKIIDKADADDKASNLMGANTDATKMNTTALLGVGSVIAGLGISALAKLFGGAKPSPIPPSGGTSPGAPTSPAINPGGTPPGAPTSPAINPGGTPPGATTPPAINPGGTPPGATTPPGIKPGGTSAAKGVLARGSEAARKLGTSVVEGARNLGSTALNTTKGNLRSITSLMPPPAGVNPAPFLRPTSGIFGSLPKGAGGTLGAVGAGIGGAIEGYDKYKEKKEEYADMSFQGAFGETGKQVSAVSSGVGKGAAVTAGALIGASLGSVIPVFGTIVGGIVGGMVGGALADVADKYLSPVADSIADSVFGPSSEEKNKASVIEKEAALSQKMSAESAQKKEAYQRDYQSQLQSTGMGSKEAMEVASQAANKRYDIGNGKTMNLETAQNIVARGGDANKNAYKSAQETIAQADEDKKKGVETSINKTGSMNLFDMMTDSGVGASKEAMQKAQDLYAGKTTDTRAGGEGESRSYGKLIETENDTKKTEAERTEAKIQRVQIEQAGSKLLDQEKTTVNRDKGIQAAGKKYGLTGQAAEARYDKDLQTSGANQAAKSDMASRFVQSQKAWSDKQNVVQELKNQTSQTDGGKNADGTDTDKVKELKEKFKYLSRGGQLDAEGNMPGQADAKKKNLAELKNAAEKDGATDEDKEKFKKAKTAEDARPKGVAEYVSANTEALKKLTEVLQGTGDQAPGAAATPITPASTTGLPPAPAGSTDTGSPTDLSGALGKLSTDIAALVTALGNAQSSGGKLEVTINTPAASEVLEVDDTQAALDEIESRIASLEGVKQPPTA